MTEILTESFCERCGTRYTFESARPRVRLKGVKVLSRGLKNFVLSDDTSIDEAMASARSEADREASAHQLDAFHKTFSFCMSCRQYTCPNCWNEAEARCLSCAPLALAEIAPPAVDDLQDLRAILMAESQSDNGAALLEPDAAAMPEFEFGVATEAPADSMVGLDELAAKTDAQSIEAEPAAEDAAGSDATSPADVTTSDEWTTDAGEELEDGAAGKAASQTLGLLQRFRPGQSLDAELDAFERERDEVAAEAEADVVQPEREPVAALDELAVATDDLAALQADRMAAAARADEREAIEPAAPDEELRLIESSAPAEPASVGTAAVMEPEGTTAAEFETEPSPESEPAPEEPTSLPIAAAAASDVVEQPTWRITAPDPTATAPAADQGGSVPLQASAAQATGATQWPDKPEWPNATAGAGLPFLGRPATPQGGIEALWAASNQELVTAQPAPGKAASGIQPCISCGLSLSATARFCRRCGTLQSR